MKITLQENIKLVKILCFRIKKDESTDAKQELNIKEEKVSRLIIEIHNLTAFMHR